MCNPSSSRGLIGRELGVFRVQLRDPVAHRCKVAVVHDDVICCCQTRISRRLRTQDLSRLLERRTISRLQAADLHFFTAIHDQNAIHRRAARRLDE